MGLLLVPLGGVGCGLTAQDAADDSSGLTPVSMEPQASVTPGDGGDLVPEEDAAVAETRTRRERMASLTAAAECQHCHRVMDPTTSSFDHCDAAGRFQELESGVAIDSSAHVVTWGGIEVEVLDSAELVEQIAILLDFVESDFFVLRGPSRDSF